MQVPDFNRLKVLVVGDVMLDRYWHGDTSRISPEAPVPVVSIEVAEERPGGAANVALNLANLGVQTNLIGQVGDDSYADQLQKLLTEHRIQFELERVPGRDTITKLRVLSRHQQLIRLDFEKSLSYNDSKQVLEKFKQVLSGTDVVILSDYAKGTLTEASDFIEVALAAEKIVVVDPKGRDYAKYRHATMVTPNMAEFELIVGDILDEQDFNNKAQNLRRQHQWQSLLITRGAKGMSLFQQGQQITLPAHAKEVFDVTGAGDTVVALLAAAMAAKTQIVDAVELANVGAAIVVGKLGAASVSVEELNLAMHEIRHPQTPGICKEEQLLDQVAAAKNRGERVVMTNGCFDLLHAGHVDYLQRAKKMGDRLIVAVNDDASVAKLKGDHRPINGLQDRMQVLAALACVDWVVAFSEDTPQRLICNVLPDVLIKGADYKIEEIAGSECVQKNGGEVVTVELRQGISTSSIIDKISGR